MARLTTNERFWQYVDIREPHECWLWLGCTSLTGYGRFTYRGRTHQAHRMVLYLLGVDIGGLMCRHTCDRPGCCNPHHLTLGTAGDNSADMVRRGRSARGSRRPNAKLNEATVLDLRRRRLAGERVMDLASECGVSKAWLSTVLTGGSWKHVALGNGECRHSHAPHRSVLPRVDSAGRRSRQSSRSAPSGAPSSSRPTPAR
jgi:hypothetical protein